MSATSLDVASATEAGWEDVDFKEIELGDKIGGGGFAVVFYGKWRGKRVALKTLVGCTVHHNPIDSASDA